MSAFCVYCCASPLFLSSVLMAHLNKVLDVSEASSTNLTYLFWDLFSFCFNLRWPRNKILYFPLSFLTLIFLLGFRPLVLPSFFHPVPFSHPSLWSALFHLSISTYISYVFIHPFIDTDIHFSPTHPPTQLASHPFPINLFISHPSILQSVYSFFYPPIHSFSPSSIPIFSFPFFSPPISSLSKCLLLSKFFSLLITRCLPLPSPFSVKTP